MYMEYSFRSPSPFFTFYILAVTVIHLVNMCQVLNNLQKYVHILLKVSNWKAVFYNCIVYKHYNVNKYYVARGMYFVTTHTALWVT